MGYGLAFLFGIYITDMDVMGYSWRSTYILAGLPGLVLSPILLVLHDNYTGVLDVFPVRARTTELAEKKHTDTFKGRAELKAFMETTHQS